MDREQGKAMREWRVISTGGSGFIGAHLCDLLSRHQVTFINLDKNPPHNGAHLAHWRRCDILNHEALEAIVLEFQPTHVVHLAASTSMEGRSLDDFRANINGTSNVIRPLASIPSIRRVVITSTQHVFRPNGRPPRDEFEYDPLGPYGQSKVLMERITREAQLACCWTIIRPTTIWGPVHPHLPGGLWRIMRRGLYLHPKGDPVVRCYGYVKNTVWQIMKILEAPTPLVDGKVLYLGDGLMKQIEWVGAFSKALTGKGVRLAPKEILHILALIGDLFGIFGVKFPMRSQRYRNLTTSNPVPIRPIIDAFGTPPYSFEEGVAQTVQWLLSNEGQSAIRA